MPGNSGGTRENTGVKDSHGIDHRSCRPRRRNLRSAEETSPSLLIQTTAFFLALFINKPDAANTKFPWGISFQRFRLSRIHSRDLQVRFLRDWEFVLLFPLLILEDFLPRYCLFFTDSLIKSKSLIPWRVSSQASFSCRSYPKSISSHTLSGDCLSYRNSPTSATDSLQPALSYLSLA